MSEYNVFVHNDKCGGAGAAGKVETPVTRGKGQAPKKNTPNSIYEKLDNENPSIVKSRTYYDENGKPFSRQDYYRGSDPHTHYEGKDLYNHEHNFKFNEKGQPIGETVNEFDPTGY